MARIREFDYEKAMERAMYLFWKTGYANTSLRDLLKAMGIGEGSFYNTFKSKKNAYLECLKHYDATVNAERVHAFASQPTAAEGVRALFRAILNCLDNPRLPKVCLLAGAIAPDVLAEKELRAYMREHEPRCEARYQQARRCSEREPADSLRDTSNVIGGWLPSLTFAFGENHYTHSAGCNLCPLGPVHALQADVYTGR